MPEISRAAQDAWQPAVIGACVGALVAYLTGRKSRNRAGGRLGGRGGGLQRRVIWGSRSVTGPIAEGAWKQVNQARDKHWLDRNPVVYG